MSALHDFRDGRGPVPAHQHPNGGGWVADTARVAASAFVGPGAQVFGAAWVSGNAQVSGAAWVFGAAQVSGDAQVSGAAWVSGNAQVSGDARVSSRRGCAQIGPVGSRGDTLTLYRTVNGHQYTTGCFAGSFDALRDAARATHGADSPTYADYGAAAVALWRIVFPGVPVPARGRP